MKTKFKIPLHISWQRIKAENLVFILNKKNEAFFTLNDSGSHIWCYLANEVDNNILDTINGLEAKEITNFIDVLIGEDLLQKEVK